MANQGVSGAEPPQGRTEYRADLTQGAAPSRGSPDRRAASGSFGGSRTPWLVLGACLALTLAATLFVTVSTRSLDQAQFQNAVQGAQDRIMGRLEIYLTVLRGSASLFAVSDSVTAAEFHAFVERLEVSARYPGIQGIGWTRRVARGLPGPVDEVHVIEYIEPLDERNRAALGFDMYGEPVRRQAMAQARDTGAPALSGPVTLVQEVIGPQQTGFLLYVPVYDTGDVPPSLEQRRAHLQGYVYSPFRADDLFAGTFGAEPQPPVSVSVYDGGRADPAFLLHASAREPGHRPRHSETIAVEIAGRPWTLVFESQPSFEAASAGGLVLGVLISCLLVTAWLFWLARGQAVARAAAEHADRAKSAFLATMSHELRTPLNAIGGYVDLLDAGIAGPITPGQQQYLERVKRAQRHLLALIEDVLDFARLGTGRLTYRPSDVVVSQAIHDAVALIQPRVAARRLKLSIDPGGDVVVRADPEKLRQILLNLLANSVKFTEPEGSVLMSWESDGGRVMIRVRDTGIGIPAEQMERIFDAFVQVEHDLTRTRQGTGLGLAISRALARGMGGDLTVQSMEGRGSTFTLILPAAPERTDPPGRVREAV